MIWRTGLLLVSLYYCIPCASQDNPAQVFGLLHHSVRLSRNLTFPVLVQEVDWNFKSKDLIKIARFERQQSTFYNNQFHERLELFDNGTTLHIQDLRIEDSGMYTAQIITTHHENVLIHFHLTVYEPVPDPSIRIVEENRTDYWCNLTLQCSASPNSSSLNYSWIFMPTDSVHEQSKDGDELHITLNQSWDTEFICIVKNPVDQKNVSNQACATGTDGGAVKRKTYFLIISLTLVPFVLLLVLVWKIKGLPKEEYKEQAAARDSKHHLSEEEEENGEEQIQQEEEIPYCVPTFRSDNSAYEL